MSGPSPNRWSSPSGATNVARVNAPTKTKVVLDESQIPTHWYNIVADLPEAPPPPLHPGTKEPLSPDDLAPLFPMRVDIPQGAFLLLPVVAIAIGLIASGAGLRRAVSVDPALAFGGP